MIVKETSSVYSILLTLALALSSTSLAGRTGHNNYHYCPTGTRVVTNATGCHICRCCLSVNQNQFVVHCHSTELSDVPPLPVNTTDLYLYSAHLRTINTTKLADLRRLRSLHLADCDIENASGWSVPRVDWTNGTGSVRWQNGTVTDTAAAQTSRGCTTQPVNVIGQGLHQLPRLNYVQVYIKHPQLNLDFLNSIQNISRVFLICNRTMTLNQQISSFRYSRLTTLRTFGCGLQMDLNVLNDWPKLIITSDKPNYIKLPIDANLNLILSNQQTTVDCMDFHLISVQRLSVLCKAWSLNLTESMFNSTQILDRFDFKSFTLTMGSVANIGRVKMASVDVRTTFMDADGYRRLMSALDQSTITRLIVTHEMFSTLDGNVTQNWLFNNPNTVTWLAKNWKHSTPNLPAIPDISGNEFIYPSVHGLLSLDLTNNVLPTITNEVAAKWSKLLVFKCKNCRIQSFPITALKQIKYLMTLEIKSSSEITWAIEDVLDYLPLLRRLVLSDLYNLDVNTMALRRNYSNLLYLDLSNNPPSNLPSITDYRWLVNLQTLILSKTKKGNNLHKGFHGFIGDIKIQNMSKLTVFEYNDNDANVTGDIDKIFQGLGLTHLGLSGNRLHNLQPNHFRRLMQPISSTLHVLDISNNKIVVITDAMLADLVALIYINMKNNLLKVIPANFLPDSKYIFEVDISNNELDQIVIGNWSRRAYLRKLNIEKGRFSCGCDLREFRDWARHSVSEYMIRIPGLNQNCSAPPQRTTTSIENYATSWIECDHHLDLVLSVAAVLALITAGVIVTLIHKYRYHLLYCWVFSRWRQPRRNRTEFTFDAYLCYCYNDRAHASIIHDRLENDQDVKFKVAIEARDFTNISISDNIVHHIKHSRKVIFLISTSFLNFDEEWNEFLLRWAEMYSVEERRKLIVLVFIETIKPGALPETLRGLKKQMTCLDWPDENDTHAQQVFWKRLKLSLVDKSQVGDRVGDRVNRVSGQFDNPAFGSDEENITHM